MTGSLHKDSTNPYHLFYRLIFVFLQCVVLSGAYIQICVITLVQVLHGVKFGVYTVRSDRDNGGM